MAGHNLNSGYLRWERNFPVACPEPSHPGIGHLQEQTFINPATKTTAGTHNVILATQEKLCNDGPWLWPNLILWLRHGRAPRPGHPLVLLRSSSSFVFCLWNGSLIWLLYKWYLTRFNEEIELSWIIAQPSPRGILTTGFKIRKSIGTQICISRF